MLTDLQRDILVKAAEDIQEGMWCRGSAFFDEISCSQFPPEAMFDEEFLTLETATRSRRCAQGELALAAKRLGGDVDDFAHAESYVRTHLGNCRCGSVWSHNDHCMDTLDVFSAGQEWARIFREVAEA